MRWTSLTAIICLMVTWLLLKSKQYPQGLILVYTLGTVGWNILVKHVVYSTVEFRDYVSWLTAPLLIVSIACIVVFMNWTVQSDENEWGDEAKIRYANMFEWNEFVVEAGPTIYMEEKLERCMTASIGQFWSIVSLDGDKWTTSDRPEESRPWTPDDIQPCFPAEPIDGSYFSESDCPRYCTKLYDATSPPITVAFVLWSTPLLMGLICFVLSFICGFLNPESSANAPATFFKLFIALLFGLWVTASLSGVGSGVGTMFTTFFMGSCLSVTMIVIATFGVPSSGAELAELNAIKSFKAKYGWALDFVRSMMVVTSSPLVIGYFGLSAVNQLVRKCGLPCSKKLNKEKGEDKLHLTALTTAQFADFKTWDHAKIYSWAIIIGIVYYTMQVLMMKWTYLFLTWMKEECAKLDFFVVSAIIVAVGMGLFLLPPVPGVPIYLTGGLMIPAVATGIGQCQKFNSLDYTADGNGGNNQGAVEFADNWEGSTMCPTRAIREADPDTWGDIDYNDTIPQFGGGSVFLAVAYTVGVGVVLKLSACTLQQKMFGENLSGYVGVRQTVSVNSSMIRTMKFILAKPGLSITKVAILVGGPDWPTSVLCGIMRLPLLQILLGTLPVFFLIVPTVMAGSFMWMQGVLDEERQPRFPASVTLSALFMVTAAMVQSGSMVVAAYYLEKAVNEQGDELAAIPIDQEVFDADARGAHMKQVGRYVSQWHLVPYWQKKKLHIGLFCIVASCYVTVMLSLGDPYDLTNSPSDLPGGPLTLLNTNGWISMGLFVKSIIWLNLWNRWVSWRVKKFETDGETMDAAWKAADEATPEEAEAEGEEEGAGAGEGAGEGAGAGGSSESVKVAVANNKVVPIDGDGKPSAS
ncbi:hypothetical protein TeGR_g5281 [Tetraparma gracilis]|uniref:Uncharacterized protein n=1 Tax=Tetraparma gracilis TaxID=2962635 RepID=A0ABQ6MYG0_9STRA|nr:hypothetical protein TeGR_g5281 [Tetraparma gracilis]